jgi:hypothetical protein
VTQAEIGGVGVLMVFVLIGVLLAARLSVKSPALRRVMYAICFTAISMLVVGVGSLRFIVEVHMPPVLPVAMLAVAISASAAIMLLAMRYGWLRNWAGRAGAGLLIYMILIIAYPPPVGPAWQLVTAVAGVALAGVGLMVWWLADAQATPLVGQTLQGGVIYGYQPEGDEDEEDNENDSNWVVVPVAGNVVVDGLREPKRDEDSGSASEVGPGEVRLPEPASENGWTSGAGVGGSSGSASESGRTSGSGAGEQPGADSGSAGGNGTGNGVAVYPANIANYRRGRGRRLAVGVVGGSQEGGAG